MRPWPSRLGAGIERLVAKGEHRKLGAALLHPPGEFEETCGHAIRGCGSLPENRGQKAVKHPVFMLM
jgi:hypothetical protein